MDLKQYTVNINDIPHTLQLDEAEARRLGVLDTAPKTKARTPQNKAKAPATKTAEPDTAEPDTDNDW